MPARKRCVGIDIGFSSIKIAEIVVDKEKLKLTKLITEEINIPPSASEDERNTEVIRTLRRAVKTYKISTKDAVFSIPGQAVIIRRERLPRTAPEQMERLIQFQAREKIPFPPAISRLEFQSFPPEEDSAQTDVLLVAIRKDHLQDYMRTITRTPFKPAGIAVSSLALFNYHTFLYDSYQRAQQKSGEEEEGKPKSAKKTKKGFFSVPKVGLQGKKKKKAEKVEEPSPQPEEEPAVEEFAYSEVKAYLNIGANSFDLSIGTRGATSRFGFARSVPRAGLEITEAIRSRLNISDYSEAEKIKREKTVILEDESRESLKKRGINIEASEAATTVVQRMIADIRRTLDFYVSQPDGMMVDSITLSGGEAYLPELPTFLEEKLGIPIETCSKIDIPQVEIDKEVDQSDIISYPIAIGLALQGLQESITNIDFLPPDLKVVREFKAKKVAVALMIATLVIMIGLGTLAGNRYINEFRDLKNRYDAVVLQNKSLKQRADDAVNKRKELEDYYNKLAKAITNRDYWLEFMTEVQKYKPEDIWLELLVLDPHGNVQIKGRSESKSSVATFTQLLKDNLQDRFTENGQPRLLGFETVYDEQLKKEVQEFDIRARCKDKESTWQKERPALTPDGPGRRRPGVPSSPAETQRPRTDLRYGPPI